VRLCRYRTQTGHDLGVIVEDMVVPFSSFESGSLPTEEQLASAVALDSAVLLPPSTPSKIVCVGRNYADHAKEMGGEVPLEPMLFLKAPSALIAQGAQIRIPGMSKEVHYEAELAIVIGRVAQAVSVESALQYVLGYTCFNDVTARDLQRKDNQWGRAKSFDTFAPMGPWIETELVPDAVRIRCLVNGEVKQEGDTSDFIFKPPELVSFISQVMTLVPGDVIATGTPAGVGPLSPGDTVEVEIAGIGKLSNAVVSA
jgi:2-keto-4-pentenoate hydratase/2-oxohepta-3-ene-1,7-dioic acid hydratase in catechol pathway